MALLRQHPDPAAAIAATTPFGILRQGRTIGSPARSPMAAQTTDPSGHKVSTVEQQRFMQQQQHRAVRSEMRLPG
eukprot:1053620-Pyramimonas_sp.AAC.1